MSLEPGPDRSLWALWQELRRRGFQLAADDYLALRAALRAGFGWPPRGTLRDLCAALWAKSRREREILFDLFDALVAPRLSPIEQPDAAEIEPGQREGDALDSKALLADSAPEPPRTRGISRLPPVPAVQHLVTRPLVFTPQFPLGYREIAQAWRRLRQPLREGPITELDIDATLERRGRSGVAVPPVLVPPRRNRISLMLLVDRNGSMAPFHHFVDELCAAIVQAGRLRRIWTYYFHDVPVEDADLDVLDALADQLFPTLDPVLARIGASPKGEVYLDRQLEIPLPLRAALASVERNIAVAIVSDGGAARDRYDLPRLVRTATLLKALRVRQARVVWLNPLPPRYWHADYSKNNTATQIARHVAMFPLDHTEIVQAVDVLRGRRYSIERPI